jgi:carboxylesterase type B
MEAVVNIRPGKVRGACVNGLYSFKGIPYAAPPFGANRLRPPHAVAPWSGVRNALSYGPKTPQPEYPPEVRTLIPEFASSGEDCLNLNIWSSELGAARQPVMVWIPGSAFQYGTAASPWYEGDRFARDGIVCVTLNYRVGAEGYLYLGKENANRALLDQVAALQWVQENISAFGGDPENVTIFGESSGAMSIGMLLSMPGAKGLFRRAILQSGAAHPVISATAAERVAGLFAQKLGVEASREAIVAVPLDRTIAAQEELTADLFAHPDPERWGAEVVAAMVLWQPVIDGAVIPARPIDLIASGASADIDLLIGTNTDEWRLFLAVGNAIDQITEEVLAAAVAAYGLPVVETVAQYRGLRPNATPGDLLATVQTDWWCRNPAIQLAEAHAQKPGATYMYEFAWRSPQFNGQLGASHALEIPFVFDTLDNEIGPLWEGNPPQQLADAMHSAWVSFASSGNPGWPKYDLERRTMMRFDTTCSVIDHSDGTKDGLKQNPGE